MGYYLLLRSHEYRRNCAFIATIILLTASIIIRSWQHIYILTDDDANSLQYPGSQIVAIEDDL